MTSRRVLGTALTVFACLVPCAPAMARSFTIEYRWQNPAWGAVPWFPTHYDDRPGQPGVLGPTSPWYTTTFVPGQGLRIVPTGNGGAIYDGVRAIWFLGAPGEAAFQRVRFTGVSGLMAERQQLRLAIQSFAGPSPGPAADVDLIHAGETFDDEDVTLFGTGDDRSKLAAIWMHTRPCPAGEPPCVSADPSLGSFILVRGAVLTLDDPTPPRLELTGPALGGEWTNLRRTTVAVRASDDGSGIDEVTGRGPGGSSLSFGRNREDRLQTLPRGPTSPPRATVLERTRTIALPRSGQFRISARASNGAKMSASAAGSVRADFERPSQLRATVDGGRLRVSARDARSGVARLTATIDGVRIADVVCAAGTCPRSAQSDALALPARQRIPVRIGATDRAGNTVSTRRVVNGPRPSGIAAVPAACGSASVVYTALVVVRGRPFVGGDGNEIVLGDRRSDDLDGASGSDCVAGGAGGDRLFGGSGDDILDGGSGRDVIEAGSGDDLVEARDGEVDEVDCGDGRDRVRLDAGEDGTDCEVRLP